MYPWKYFTLNFFINDIFSVEKFLNYGIIYHMVLYTINDEGLAGIKLIKEINLAEGELLPELWIYINVQAMDWFW